MGGNSQPTSMYHHNSSHANLLIMEDATPKNQNPQVILKNPWWVKLIPHVVIISQLLNLLINKNWFSLIVVFLWIWYGNKLQKNKIIETKFLRFILLFLAIVNIPNIVSKFITILQMLSALL